MERGLRERIEAGERPKATTIPRCVHGTRFDHECGWCQVVDRLDTITDDLQTLTQTLTRLVDVLSRPRSDPPAL